MTTTAFRTRVLRRFGATEATLDELLHYNRTTFDPAARPEPMRLPLPDEPHLEAWRRYAEAGASHGLFEELKRHLVQLNFPIRAGISDSDAYRTATRRGRVPASGNGLTLNDPDGLRLLIHDTPAGRLPVLVVEDRDDFVALLRALTRRNEPVPIPDSMGACMIAGYNNWGRIADLKAAWMAEHPATHTEARWGAYFRTIIPRKERYQDRFILLSDGPYSAVPAAAVGLSETAWRTASRTIRLEHECAHYFTRRLLGSMRNALFDELLADYAGLVAAAGSFRADWFCRFMGLERFPVYREGGRLQNYRGDPPLSDDAFLVLHALVKHAADNLERVDRTHRADGSRETTTMLLALTRLTLEEIASDTGGERIEEAVEQARAALLLDAALA